MFRFDSAAVPDIRTSPPGPNAEALLARDAEFVSPSYTRFYPLVVDRASGCVVRDVDGNLFLDFTAGIAVTNAGHCHPEVVAAIADQADKLIHMSGTDFYYGPQIDLAERLAKAAPGPTPKKVFFANSGAEAVEAALKLARWHTRRNRVIAFHGAFHGRTYGALSLSASKSLHRRGFSPLMPDIHHVPFPGECSPWCFSRAGVGSARPLPDGRGSEVGRGANCSCLAPFHELFRRTAPPDEVAAIFVEPVQGEGGYRPAPPGFLPALRALCDEHGILLVLDEVQSGMGRTGKLFAVEHFPGVEPDLICLAKGIANGLPLGAVVAKAHLMDWPPGSHASTFGGNPVACRAALATMDLLEREYIANAAERGEQLRAGLRRLADTHPTIGNVRGLGLMTAVDCVRPDPPGTGDPKLRDEGIQAAFRRGLLLLGCGEAGVRFSPPLCVTAGQVETALQIFGEVLAEVGGRVCASA